MKQDSKTARRQDGKSVDRDSAHVAGGSTRSRLAEPGVVEIRPEPSPAELAAILIALEQILAAPRLDAPRRSAWALAGRRESLLGGEGGRGGWGRGSDQLAGR